MGRERERGKKGKGEGEKKGEEEREGMTRKWVQDNESRDGGARGGR